jgi:hypothetical protein
VSTLSIGADLPDLRIVAASALVLHEDADERRVATLARRLTAEAAVKNPPVVAPMADGRFVVLDGANRTSALAQLLVPDVVVQVTDYERVALSTWNHLVVGLEPDQILAALREVPSLTVAPATRSAARARLADSDSLAYVISPDGTLTELSGGSDRVSQASLLRLAVATYKGQGHIHRIQSDDIEQLQTLYSEIGALIVFPRYQTADILALASADAKLPSGITRHVIPLRALRLNLPLDVLAADTNLAEKNRWLTEWIRGRLQAGHIRFYAEPTVLFDE